MRSADSSRVLIVGCGASLRRDDQAGLRIGESLATERLPDGVEVELSESPAADIPSLLEGRSDIGLLVIIDAATPGENHPPGTWRRFDCPRRCSTDRSPLRESNPYPVGVVNDSTPLAAVEASTPLGVVKDTAPLGAVDVSPGRKPWVRDASSTSEPRRGDRADGPYDVHGPGVEAAIELCATLGILPADVWVYAVAAADTGYGEELSAPVAAAMDGLTARIRDDVRDWLAGRECQRA